MNLVKPSDRLEWKRSEKRRDKYGSEKAGKCTDQADRGSAWGLSWNRIHCSEWPRRRDAYFKGNAEAGAGYGKGNELSAKHLCKKTQKCGAREGGEGDCSSVEQCIF